MEHPKPNPPEAPAIGHELTDAGPLPILLFALSLIAMLVIVHFLSLHALRYVEHNVASNMGQVGAPLVPPPPPPDPRLEPEPSRDVLPRADLIAVQARERALIDDHAWAWVDSNHHFARIPIQQAIDLAVAQGLPTLLPATQPSNQPFMPPASALHGPGGVP
jgi:hypothetical protein